MRLTCSLTAVFIQGDVDVVAYVPEIPGVHGQGATIDDARASLADALEMVLSSNRSFTQESYRDGLVIHREAIEPRVRKAGH